MKTYNKHRLPGSLLLGSGLAVIAACAVFVFAEDMLNPLANFWRMVREGTAGYTAVSSEGHDTLIVTSGEIWREFRNILLIDITPWLMGLVLAVIVIFHLINGGEQLPEPRSGIKFKRYSLGERILHWYTAILFILLAITGLSLLLGRAFLLPVAGHGPFAAYLQVSKIVHNWSGPLFLLGVAAMFILWVGDNIIHKRDIIWFKSLGGMIGSGDHPPAEKVNGGEKAWFWLIVLFGTAVGITGVILDFPIWGQGRATMQISLAVHAVVGVLFVTASFGHIYMGTAGSEGAFEGMWKGEVDAVWAKRHCSLWYEKKAREDDRLDL